MFRRASEIDKYNNLIKLLIFLTLLLAVGMWIDNIVTENWIDNKKKVACVPQTDNVYPSVYDQSIANPLAEDIKIKNFIYDYVYFTETEKYADFHKVIKSEDPKAKRYDKARLSKNKKQALYMSALNSREYKEREFQYAYSNKRYKELESEGKNVIFHIDQIIVNPVPFSLFSKVVVRGFKREYWDFKDSQNRRKQNRLAGRFEIVYDVMYDLPEKFKDQRGNLKHMNKYGLFVVGHKKFPLNKRDYNERISFSRNKEFDAREKTALELLKNLYEEKVEDEE